MVRISDELLIEAVKHYPHLYDIHHQHFHDTKERDGAWIEISNRFEKCSALSCKRRWTTLRDCFRKALKKRRFTQESGKTWRYEGPMGFLVPFITARTPKQCSNVSSLEYAAAAEAAENESDVGDEQSSTDFNEYGNEIKFALLESSSQEYVPQTATELLASCSKANEELNRNHENDTIDKHDKDLKRCLVELTDTIAEAKRSKDDNLHGDDALSVFFRAMEKTVRTFRYPLQIKIKGKIANLVNDYELENFQSNMNNG